MPGDSPSLKQEDIEELLRQAQMASGLVPEGAAAPDAAAPASAQSAESSATAAAASSAASTATMDPRPPAFVRSPADRNVGDDVQYLLSQAEQAIASVAEPVEPPLAGLAPFELKDLAGAP